MGMRGIILSDTNGSSVPPEKGRAPPIADGTRPYYLFS
ncbi:hypothetical protein L248_2323 [Schleiferilactobacillus shenzhenensis LY-73]|uniref:Uncharacterized protein n=1 Tax=Schleiferilactobacillus shenzhenensis LY-73 TaxID=1231336 RepID=U4TW75_9LACO|nr:hypothetical protein L248_2323 [Schleiferilactobacillus shenzhenensis LY-73]